MKELDNKELEQIAGGEVDEELVMQMYNLHKEDCFKDPYHQYWLYKFKGIKGNADDVYAVIFVFDVIDISPVGNYEVIQENRELDFTLFRALIRV